MKLGDIRLNNKYYTILSDPNNYRVADMVDFAPRASTPGGSAVHSQLGMYQPYLQTDWRHGFGFQWFEDEAGYMRTEGNVDTRHNGIAMLSTKATSSDTDNYAKEGFTVWNNKLWAWGDHGLRKYESGTWAQAQDVAGTDTNDVVIQPALADAFINKAATTTNYGTNVMLGVGEANDAAQLFRGLIKFDLSDIPSNATITSATLSLYLDSEKSSNTRSIYAYRLLKDWDEASVTWAKYDTSNSWTTAGGFDAADCEQTDIGSVSLSATEADGWKDITLTAAKVTEWVNSTLANYGLLLKVDTESSDQYRFHSSDYVTDTTLRPKLTLTYTTPALSDTGKVNFAMPSGKYLFYCPDGARIRKISTEGTDSFTGNDTSSIDYKWLITYSGYIYAGKDGSNAVHRDSNSELIDLEGTTSDTDIIYVGAQGGPSTIGAVVYGGYLYVSTREGLWQIGDDLIARKILDFSSETSDDNFRSMSVFNGYLLFPIRDKVYQWNGSRLSDVTPPRITDSFPYTTYGRFDNFTSMGRFMYCTARTNETTYKEDLLCWDGVAWSKLMNLVPAGTDTITAMGFDSVNNRLWYHLDSTADATYYIPFQSSSELPYADFPTTGTHSLYLSRWDMGYRWVDKSTPSIVIEASNCSSNSYLSVYYSLDGGAFTKWGDVKENGAITLLDPTAGGTAEFNYITLRIDFTTTDGTNSPILEGVTLRFIMRPDEADGWMLNIPIAQNIKRGVTEETRTATQIVQDLRTARRSKSPIDFVDLDGSQYKVYVTALSRRMTRMDAEESGGIPKLEYVATLNLLEAV